MDQITVAMVAPAVPCFPIWVAQQNGYFAEASIEATILITGTTDKVTSALPNNDAQRDHARRALRDFFSDDIVPTDLSIEPEALDGVISSARQAGLVADDVALTYEEIVDRSFLSQR